MQKIKQALLVFVAVAVEAATVEVRWSDGKRRTKWMARATHRPPFQTRQAKMNERTASVDCRRRCCPLLLYCWNHHHSSSVVAVPSWRKETREANPWCCYGIWWPYYVCIRCEMIRCCGWVTVGERQKWYGEEFIGVVEVIWLIVGWLFDGGWMSKLCAMYGWLSARENHKNKTETG